MSYALALNGLLVVTLALAMAWDMRTQRIPNGLTLPPLALGFVLNGMRGGSHGLLFSFEGLGIAGVFLLFWALGGGLGAGDVKLLGAVGALMGPSFALWTLLGSALAGGLLAMGFAWKRGTLAQSLATAWLGGQRLISTRSPEAWKGMAAISPADKMPYAPAIALGAAAAATACLLHAGVMP